jgi:transcriptional regulator with XRE-family HTH domain
MVILSKFAENLLALMEEHNINAPALAEKLNLHRTSITRYLCGERLPNYEDFVALIEYFNVSADVLLGRIDYSDVKEFHPIQPFGTTLQQAMKEAKVSQYRIQKDLHFSSATTNSWVSNKKLPAMDRVDKLADYLDVSVDYLLGRIS